MAYLYYSNEDILVPLYDSIFLTSSVHIKKLAEKVGIDDIAFAYELDRNPTGISRPQYKTITLSYKIVSELHKGFGNAQYVVENYASENLKRAFASRGVSPDEVMIFDIAEFQIDHEFAHHLQDLVDPTSASEANTQHSEHMNTIPEKHAREIDADWFATEQLAQRIANTFRDQDGKWTKPLPEEIEGKISLKLIAINNFLYGSIREKDLQLEKGPYPDPQIRKEIIARDLIDKVRRYLPPHLQFNSEKAISDADSFLFNMFAGTDYFNPEYNFVEDVSTDLKNNAEKVKTYITQLYQKGKSMPNLCMNGKAESFGLSAL